MNNNPITHFIRSRKWSEGESVQVFVKNEGWLNCVLYWNVINEWYVTRMGSSEVIRNWDLIRKMRKPCDQEQLLQIQLSQIYKSWSNCHPLWEIIKWIKYMLKINALNEALSKFN